MLVSVGDESDAMVTDMLLNSQDRHIKMDVVVVKGENLRGDDEPQVRHALVGVLRDLRGVVTACSNRRTYALFFEWLYPEFTPLLNRAAHTYFDSPDVTTPLLKLYAKPAAAAASSQLPAASCQQRWRLNCSAAAAAAAGAMVRCSISGACVTQCTRCIRCGGRLGGCGETRTCPTPALSACLASAASRLGRRYGPNPACVPHSPSTPPPSHFSTNGKQQKPTEIK